MKSYLVALYEFLVEVVFMLPRFPIINSLKSVLLRALGAQIGKHCVFYPGVWIMTGRGLVVGDRVDFARGVLITTDGGVVIGDRTLIGYGAKILSRNHVIPSVGRSFIDSGHVAKKVVIGKDCWIGANSIILPGVRLGDGVVVAAGSVVTKSQASNSIVGGVPAKLIRKRG
ncbi:MAG: acyltransferase [Oceanospirillaceae bacterium]|nr:acyltransferase [Oceanospirillaceae bacterium]